MLNITKAIAKKLRRVQATIVTATDAVTSCIDAIQFYCENENEFENLFEQAENFYGERIPMP